MAFKWTERKELAAARYASGRMSVDDIAKEAGLTARGFQLWAEKPEFKARVEEHVEAFRKSTKDFSIADASNRMQATTEDWVSLRETIANRARTWTDRRRRLQGDIMLLSAEAEVELRSSDAFEQARGRDKLSKVERLREDPAFFDGMETGRYVFRIEYRGPSTHYVFELDPALDLFERMYGRVAKELGQVATVKTDVTTGGKPIVINDSPLTVEERADRTLALLDAARARRDRSASQAADQSVSGISQTDASAEMDG